MVRYLVLLAITLAPAPSLAGATSCLKYEKLGTSVIGTLTRVRVETRTVGQHPHFVTVTRWMLDAPKPFCVEGNQALGNIAMQGASSIELVTTDPSNLVPLIGNMVQVTGSLMSSYIPHYHPYLVMRVRSVHGVNLDTSNQSSKRTR